VQKLIDVRGRRNHGRKEKILLRGKSLKENSLGHARSLGDLLGGSAKPAFYEYAAGRLQQIGIGNRLPSTHPYSWWHLEGGYGLRARK